MAGLAIFLFWLAVFFTLGSSPAVAAEFTILHSNNLTGHLYPCPT